MQVEFFEAARFGLNKSFHYYSGIDTELESDSILKFEHIF